MVSNIIGKKTMLCYINAFLKRLLMFNNFAPVPLLDELNKRFICVEITETPSKCVKAK